MQHPFYSPHFLVPDRPSRRGQGRLCVSGETGSFLQCFPWKLGKLCSFYFLLSFIPSLLFYKARRETLHSYPLSPPPLPIALGPQQTHYLLFTLARGGFSGVDRCCPALSFESCSHLPDARDVCGLPTNRKQCEDKSVPTTAQFLLILSLRILGNSLNR